MRDDASLSTRLYACCPHCDHPPLLTVYSPQEVAAGCSQGAISTISPCWSCSVLESLEDEARREGDHVLGQTGHGVSPYQGHRPYGGLNAWHRTLVSAKCRRGSTIHRGR